MINELSESKSKVKIIYDEKGKILNPKIDISPGENEPITRFVAKGVLKFKLEYSDSLFIIRPLENTYCPVIKIEMSSFKAYINNEVLDSITEISIDHENNVFKSAWNGFQWTTNTSDDTSQITPRLTLGIIKERGQYYVEIIWLEGGRSKHYRLLS